MYFVHANRNLQDSPKYYQEATAAVVDVACRETRPTIKIEVLVADQGIDQECDHIHEAPSDPLI
jgi:hypothetical protein